MLIWSSSLRTLAIYYQKNLLSKNSKINKIMGEVIRFIKKNFSIEKILKNLYSEIVFFFVTLV